MDFPQFVFTVITGVLVTLLSATGTYILLRRCGWTGLSVWLLVVVVGALFIVISHVLFDNSSWIRTSIGNAGMTGSCLGGLLYGRVGRKQPK